jgi:nucleoside-diphosphate-sugar epimerase
VYASRSTALALTLAAECARRSIPAFVELSTGKVYKPPSSSTIAAGGCTETAPVKPWLKLAKHKLYAEEGLERLAREGSDEKGRLQYVILRLAHVYGEYDKGFLARGLCLARVYQARNEELKWLYGKNLRINTVHVHDACSAAWAAAVWCAANPITSAWSIPPNSSSPTIPAPPTSPTSPTTPATHTPTAEAISRIFNIVDEGDTSQADLANIISATFHMKTGFQNALINAFAKFNLESVVDDVNEEVLQPWADLLAEKGIVRAGPIGPWMEKELLKDCNLCLNAEKAKHTLGWSVGPDTRKLREEAVNDVVESYRRMGWWP